MYEEVKEEVRGDMNCEQTRFGFVKLQLCDLVDRWVGRTAAVLHQLSDGPSEYRAG